jgi:hypothetical protein
MKNTLQLLLVGFFSFICITFGTSQDLKLNDNKPHFYAGASYYQYRDFSEVEQNSLFRETGFYTSSPVNLTAGVQINSALSLELNYLNADLRVSQAFGDNGAEALGISDLNVFSFSVINNINLIKNRLSILPKVGYSMAFHSQTAGLSVGGSFGQNGDLFSSNERTVLRDGRLDYITFGLSLECVVYKNISVFAGYLMHKGFRPLVSVETEYEYQGEEGAVQSVSDGTIGGLELGLKYRFK